MPMFEEIMALFEPAVLEIALLEPAVLETTLLEPAA